MPDQEKLGGYNMDLHDAVLVLTDDGAACVLDVRPVAIVKLHGIGDHFGENRTFPVSLLGLVSRKFVLLRGCRCLLSSRNCVPSGLGVTRPLSLARRMVPNCLPFGSYQ